MRISTGNRHEGYEYYSCSRCGLYLNPAVLSKFRGYQIKHPNLAAGVEYYAHHAGARAVNALDMAAACTIPLKAAAFIVSTLRRLEAREGQHQSATLTLQGVVEADAHGLRRCWVSNANPHFKEELAIARARHPHKRPKAWSLWVRVAALMERAGSGGRVVLALLPHKLCLPEAKPPPESTEEVVGSRLLLRMGPKAGLYPDGAQAWRAAAREQGLHRRKYDVCHSKFVFVRDVDAPPDLSKKAGTQSEDRRWGWLDGYIPQQITTKKNKKVNDALLEYAYSWVWRQNRAAEPMLTSLGRLCKAS